jgi:predicted dehydrogenase
MTPSKVRLGIAGLGGIGTQHARAILDGKVSGLELAAGSDFTAARAANFPGLPFFATPEEMIRSGLIDAILIATPHFSHTTIGIAALQAGLHVLVEKPISVHKADAEKLIAARTRPDQVFAGMFNQRTDPRFIAIRRMARDGTLGEIRRINWTVTDWYRTDAYFASGGWRATWQGEGGGVLLNQGMHNLDLISWLFGQPRRVRAFCSLGRYHNIEVEDDVTAFLEFENGATMVFATSTGEAPGTNRLEIAAENGKIVMESNEIVFTRNEIPMSEFSRSGKDGARPAAAVEVIPCLDNGGQCPEILQNFAEAIQKGVPLLAPAEEGIRAVELANAMLLSSFENRAVELPLDAALYEKVLKQKIAESPRSRKE